MSTSSSLPNVKSLMRLSLAAGFSIVLMVLFAVPAFASSWKGQGTMSVSVATSQGAESGFEIVDHSSTGNTLTFTFTNGGTVSGTGAVVDVVVPSGWTAPSKTASTGTVAIASGATCTGSSGTGTPAIGTITGTGPYTIPISLDCGANAGFTLTYSNVTAPTAPAAGTQTETTFTTSTKGSSDTSAGAIAAAPVVQVSGAATSFTVSATSPQTAGTSFTVGVTAMDANGITAVGYVPSAFTWSSNAAAAPDGTPPSIPSSAPAFTNGSASDSSFIFYKANQSSVKVTATDGSVTGSSGTITVNPAATSQFVVSAGLTETAGTPFSVSVSAKDQFLNTTPSYSPASFVWSSTATNSPNNTPPTIPSSSPSFSSGNASCNLCFTFTNAGETPTITATDGSITGSTAAITVNPGAGASFDVLVNGGSPVTAGSSFDVALTARDLDGNVAIGYSADGSFGWSTTATGNPTIPSGIPTFSNGVSDTPGFILTNTNETPTISASDGGVSGTSAAITVQPGAGTQLKFTVQPTSAVLYETISPAVQVAVEDASGNVVTSATNSITLSFGASGNANDATLRGTVTQNAQNGVATFSNLSLDQVGSNYTLTALTTGAPDCASSILTCDVSHSFDITGSAVKVTLLSPKFGPPSGTGVGGKPISITGSGFGLKGNTTTQVFFGTTQSTGVTVLSNTLLTATVPAGTGAVHVQVVTPASSSDPTTPQSLYSYGPMITSLTPNVFNPTATTHTVTISGKNLIDPVDSSLPTVTFGSCGAGTGVIFVSLTKQIKVTPPSSCSAGAVHVVLTTTSGGSSDASQPATLFYYGPKVTNVLPKVGPSAGSTSPVTITGANFGTMVSGHFVPNVSSVSFGSNVLTTGFTVSSATTIKVAALPAQASGDPATVDVVVTGPAGPSAKVTGDRFTYGPILNSVTPSAGKLTASTFTGVSLAGRNLTGATQVVFGDVPVNLSGFCTSTTCTATLIKIPKAQMPASYPSGTKVNVYVVTPAGQSALKLTTTFTFQ
jgi:hypothetical protein